MSWDIYVVFLLFFVAGNVSTEPCEDYTVISDNERAANIQLDLDKTYSFTDDRLHDGWYRVVNDVGEEMATSPPGTFNCTTWFPIWLDGSLPTAINVTVKEPVCVQTFTSTCERTWDIEIKRCPEDYLVYKLKASTLVDSGHCFGWAVPCPEGQTGWFPNCRNVTTTTTSTTTSATTVSTTTASTMTSTTSASSTMISSPKGDGSVRDSKKRGNDEEKTNYTAIVSAIIVAVCMLLLIIFFVMMRNKMIQKRCNIEESENKKNLYQEIIKEHKDNKGDDHIYSIPVWTTYPEDSPPPYSSRPPSATTDRYGWSVDRQKTPPVYLFTVGKEKK